MQLLRQLESVLWEMMLMKPMNMNSQWRLDMSLEYDLCVLQALMTGTHRPTMLATTTTTTTTSATTTTTTTTTYSDSQTCHWLWCVCTAGIDDWHTQTNSACNNYNYYYYNYFDYYYYHYYYYIQWQTDMSLEYDLYVLQALMTGTHRPTMPATTTTTTTAAATATNSSTSDIQTHHNGMICVYYTGLDNYYTDQQHLQQQQQQLLLAHCSSNTWVWGVISPTTLTDYWISTRMKKNNIK